jgi:Zn-dependent protease with chaperone function
VFETKLIDVPQAVVALYQRAVILISRPALRLVSGAELQALVAHEIGHEYFWADFERTLERGDKLGRQELELKCDGIAVLTIIGGGGQPDQLIAGLRKMLRFNEAIGAVANAEEYPRLQDRERFVSAIRALALPSRSSSASDGGRTPRP